jgi:hypothetical protein
MATVQRKLTDDATKQAESSQKVSAAAAPTQQQLSNAVTTLGTYSSIPQNMRAGLANEMKAAPDWETLQKVQARADAANESFQRSADARQQAMTLKDVGIQQMVAGKLVQEDQKLGTSLDQTGAIRRALDMSQGGNEQAGTAAKQLFAEHIVKQGGINRFNELEQQGLIGNMGTFARQIQSWADKGFDPKQIPSATNAEMQTILNAEDQAASSAHDRNVGFVMNRFGGVDKPGSQQAPQPQSRFPSPQTPITNQPTKVLTQDAVTRAAKDHGVSVEEATRQAKAAGYTVQ